MKGYKTLILNGALAVVPLIDVVVSNGALVSALTPHAAEVMSIIGLINVVLRWVTTTPVLKSE